MPDPTGGLISAGIGLIGSSMQADAATDAAQTAADASRFKPFGVTTRFGKSGFQYDAAGNPIGGGYQVAPDVAAMREYMLNNAGQSLGQFGQALSQQPFLNQQAQGLMNLGSQYLAQSPQQAASQWMSQQQGLLQPARDQAYGRMQQNLFNTGRGGLAVSQGGSLGAANPEAQAYYNALAQQDAQLAAQAQQAGQAQTTFGAGLLGTGMQVQREGYNTQQQALAPWQTAFKGAQMAESSGQGALDIGSSLGAQQSSSGANAAQYLAAQGISPVGTTLMNMAQTPGLFSGGYNPAQWSNPGANTGGFYPYGGSAFDVGNVS